MVKSSPHRTLGLIKPRQGVRVGPSHPGWPLSSWTASFLKSNPSQYTHTYTHTHTHTHTSPTPGQGSEIEIKFCKVLRPSVSDKPYRSRSQNRKSEGTSRLSHLSRNAKCFHEVPQPLSTGMELEMESPDFPPALYYNK